MADTDRPQNQPYPEDSESCDPSNTTQAHQKPPSPKPRKPNRTENRLRPATDLVNRIIWDPAFDASDYLIGYEDRFEGYLEAGIKSWKRDFTDEEFIPQHRIVYIRRSSDGEVVWDRRRRIDRVFWSGNSACAYLDFLN